MALFCDNKDLLNNLIPERFELKPFIRSFTQKQLLRIEELDLSDRVIYVFEDIVREKLGLEDDSLAVATLPDINSANLSYDPFISIDEIFNSEYIKTLDIKLNLKPNKKIQSYILNTVNNKIEYFRESVVDEDNNPYISSIFNLYTISSTSSFNETYKNC